MTTTENKPAFIQAPELPTAGAIQKKTCFVAMPFRDPFERYYKHVYVSGIEAAGCRPVRTDDIFSAGDVIRQMAILIVSSPVLLADVTTPNANVYYEIGLAHAWKIPTILVTHSPATVPFDLRGGRVLSFDKDDPNWGDILRTQIARAIVETLTNPRDALPAALLGIDLPPREVPPDEDRDWRTNFEQQLSQLQKSIELTTRQPEITASSLAQAESARETIRILLAQGATHQTVLKALISAGTSKLWAAETIKEISEELAASAPDDDYHA